MAVIVKPTGKTSLRSTEAAPVSADVCEELDGGGHPKAAGCDPTENDDSFDRAAHVAEHGLGVMREVTRALVPALLAHKNSEDNDGDGEAADATESRGATDGATA